MYVLLLLLPLVACGPNRPEFSRPPDDAPVIDLSAGEWPGTNALIHPPASNDDAR